MNVAGFVVIAVMVTMYVLLDGYDLGVGAISPQVLTHQAKPRFEQIERCAKGVSGGWSGWRGRGHPWIVASRKAAPHAVAPVRARSKMVATGGI